MKPLIVAVILVLLGILGVVAYRVQTKKMKVVQQTAVPIYAKDAQGFQRPGKTYKVTLSKDEWSDAGLSVKSSQTVSVVPASVNEPFVLKIGDIEKDALPGNGGDGSSEGVKRPAFGISLSVLPTSMASDSDDYVHTDTQEKILLRMSDKASVASIDVLVLIEDVKLKSPS